MQIFYFVPKGKQLSSNAYNIIVLLLLDFMSENFESTPWAMGQTRRKMA